MKIMLLFIFVVAEISKYLLMFHVRIQKQFLEPVEHLNHNVKSLLNE